jgi:hypothetical protein
MWAVLAQWYSAGLRAAWSGVREPAGGGNFFLHHCVQSGSVKHPIYYTMRTRGSFLGIKRPGREVNYSPPSSSEFKNAWNYTSALPIRRHGVVLSKAQRQLYLLPFTTVSRQDLGSTQPPLQWVSGALSLEVKRPGREADHSPPSSADVKNAWSYTSTPQYAFMA